MAEIDFIDEFETQWFELVETCNTGERVFLLSLTGLWYIAVEKSNSRFVIRPFVRESVEQIVSNNTGSLVGQKAELLLAAIKRLETRMKAEMH
jgi:hypothetical protein